MSKMKVPWFILFALALVSSVFAPVSHANSAEPPSILIIVRNAPDDLEITMGPENTEARRTNKVGESYYAFYYSQLLRIPDRTVRVTTENSTFETTFDPLPKNYNNIYTLDLGSKTLTPGKAPLRSLTLLPLRITLTLLIEGFIFFVFGYRQKKSWLYFIVINLITQGLLYLWLNASLNPLTAYAIFSLIFGEILVVIVELIVLLAFVKEHSRWRTASCVLAANLLSLIAGGYLITVLPV